MARLVLVILALILLALAIGGMIRVTNAAVNAAHTALGDDMPKTFQNIAYVVLILLMLGVVTGLLGGI